MKIVVKSTKTISFDEGFDEDESSDHENNESEIDGSDEEVKSSAKFGVNNSDEVQELNG